MKVLEHQQDTKGWGILMAFTKLMHNSSEIKAARTIKQGLRAILVMSTMDLLKEIWASLLQRKVMMEWCPRRMSFHRDSKLAGKQNGISCMEQFAFVLRGANSFPRMRTVVYCVWHLNFLTVIKIMLDSKVWVLEGLSAGIWCEMTGSEQGKDSALAATIEATLFASKKCVHLALGPWFSCGLGVGLRLGLYDLIGLFHSDSMIV